MMKKYLSLIFFCALILTCNNNIERIDLPEKSNDDELVADGNINVNVKIELPPDTSIFMSELEVFSVFDIDEIPENGVTDLEVYNGNSYELAMVNNSNGETLMMGYIDPSITEVQTINTETTAIALILLNPWAIGLTKEAKKEVTELLPTFSEFSALVKQVEQGVKNGSIASVDISEIQGKLINSITSKKPKSKISKEITPLDVSVEDEEIQVYHDFDETPVSYSLSLFKEGKKIDEKLLLGNLKSQLSVDMLRNGSTVTVNDAKMVSFGFREDGVYKLEAKSGLSFDPDHKLALQQNTLALFYETLGLITSASKEIFKNAACAITFVELLLAKTEYKLSLLQYGEGKISATQLLKSTLSAIKDVFSVSNNLLDNCLNIKNALGTTGKLFLGFLDIIGKVEGTINATSILIDWNKLPKEIDVCLENKGTDYAFCNSISVTAENGFDFGKVPIGQEVSTKIKIKNTSDQPITIYDIEVLNETGETKFTTNFNSEKKLEPQGEFEFDLNFKSLFLAEQAIIREIYIENGVDDINGKFDVSVQKVINAIEVTPLDLDFGEVKTGESSLPRFFTIKNVSDHITKISSLLSNPNGYSYSPLISEEITPNEPLNVEVIFSPVDEVKYESKIEISNSSDSIQEKIIVSLNGEGVRCIVEGTNDANNDGIPDCDRTLIVNIDGGNDFGKVETGEMSTKTMSIKNNSSETIEITSIANTDIFKFERNNTSIGGLFIDPQVTINDIIITFQPNTNMSQVHIQEFDIITDKAVNNYKFQLKGEEVYEENCGDQDSDGDGVFDDCDNCPNDENKTESGSCGCGIADTDTDGDGIADCDDNCPNTANSDQTDLNGNGIGDVCEGGINLSGEWTPTWEVAQCDKLGSYCCGCSFHENARNFVFISDTNGCVNTDLCGILDWNTQRIGNSDVPTINEWFLNDTTLTIKIISAQSSGWQFTYRDLNFTGSYDEVSDSFVGNYTSDFTGGLIISAKSTGKLTLKRVQ